MNDLINEYTALVHAIDSASIIIAFVDSSFELETDVSMILGLLNRMPTYPLEILFFSLRSQCESLRE